MLELVATGVPATIAVEAADRKEEKAALLAACHACDWIAGVVGWVPLDRPDEAGRLLDRLARISHRK